MKPRISITKFCLASLSLATWKQMIEDFADDPLCDLGETLIFLTNDILAGINFKGSENLGPVKDLVTAELELRQRAIFLIMVPPVTGRIEA